MLKRELADNKGKRRPHKFLDVVKEVMQRVGATGKWPPLQGSLEKGQKNCIEYEQGDR